MLSNHRSTRRLLRSCSTPGLFSLCLACSSGEVDLGSGLISQDFTRSSRCADSPVLEGDVSIASQRELESLTGCEVIRGSLRVGLFAGADLSPLSSLRVVDDVLALGDPPSQQPETPEEAQALQALQDDGYLPSLQGLAALERVGTLLFMSLQISDLTALESLDSVRGLVGTNLLQLSSLAGLEGIELEELWLTNTPALTSLDGLLMVDTVDSLVIDSAPALSNVDAIAAVDFVNSLLMLSNTGLTSLPQLALVGAAQISIDNNRDLLDIEGIAGLVGCQQLHVAANPKLRALPGFNQLMDLDFLTILGNGVETLSLSFPAFAPQAVFVRDRELLLSAPLLEIGLNPQLTRLALPLAFEAAQNLSIYENERLAAIDFGSLKNADLLLIDANPALTSIATPQLATVDHLVITNNPRLVPSAFDGVATFSRELSGNAAP